MKEIVSTFTSTARLDLVINQRHLWEKYGVAQVSINENGPSIELRFSTNEFCKNNWKEKSIYFLKSSAPNTLQAISVDPKTPSLFFSNNDTFIKFYFYDNYLYELENSYVSQATVNNVPGTKDTTTVKDNVIYNYTYTENSGNITINKGVWSNGWSAEHRAEITDFETQFNFSRRYYFAYKNKNHISHDFVPQIEINNNLFTIANPFSNDGENLGNELVNNYDRYQDFPKRVIDTKLNPLIYSDFNKPATDWDWDPNRPLTDREKIYNQLKAIGEKQYPLSNSWYLYKEDSLNTTGKTVSWNKLCTKIIRNLWKHNSRNWYTNNANGEFISGYIYFTIITEIVSNVKVGELAPGASLPVIYKTQPIDTLKFKINPQTSITSLLNPGPKIRYKNEKVSTIIQYPWLLDAGNLSTTQFKEISFINNASTTPVVSKYNVVFKGDQNPLSTEEWITDLPIDDKGHLVFARYLRLKDTHNTNSLWRIFRTEKQRTWEVSLVTDTLREIWERLKAPTYQITGTETMYTLIQVSNPNDIPVFCLTESKNGFTNLGVIEAHSNKTIKVLTSLITLSSVSLRLRPTHQKSLVPIAPGDPVTMLEYNDFYYETSIKVEIATDSGGNTNPDTGHENLGKQ